MIDMSVISINNNNIKSKNITTIIDKIFSKANLKELAFLCEVHAYIKIMKRKFIYKTRPPKHPPIVETILFLIALAVIVLIVLGVV